MKNPKIVVYVSGGVVQCVRSNKHIDVTVFDVDNLRENKTGNQIDEEWDKMVEAYPICCY